MQGDGGGGGEGGGRSCSGLTLSESLHILIKSYTLLILLRFHKNTQIHVVKGDFCQ